VQDAARAGHVAYDPFALDGTARQDRAVGNAREVECLAVDGQGVAGAIQCQAVGDAGGGKS